MKRLIKNGFVIDPANGINSKLNIITENGTVAAVTCDAPECDEVIDAEGKYVVPGLIDIHMHEEEYDGNLKRLKKTITLAMLKMGVTTAIGGNCGLNTMEPAEYLDEMDNNGGPVNMGLFAGHTFFREKAGCVDKYGAVSRQQLEKMKRAMTESLEKGCVGVSFGIRYVPGIDRTELMEISSLCRGRGKLVSAHIRNDASYVFGALQELLDVTVTENVPIQVSHIGSMGGFGQMKKMLEIIDEYKANNYDVAADCYPYYAYSTMIGEASYDEGFLERYNTDYSSIEICEGKYKGQRCDEKIFNELRQTAPKTITVAHLMLKEDVDMALLHPDVMIASDGLMHDGQGHPRAAGTFPRFINNYVKTGRLPLYSAIEKMTVKQADRLGLAGKGRLNKGADADILIFDLDRIKDGATFEDPMAEPSGIEYVLIGGETAVEKGKVVNDSLGRAIRKF